MKFDYDISPVLLPSIEAERRSSLVVTADLANPGTQPATPDVPSYLRMRFTQMLQEIVRKHAALPSAETGAVPQSVSRRAGIQALIDMDMIDAVETAIANLPAVTETERKLKRTIQNEYINAQEFERYREVLVYMLKNVLGKTDTEIDALFVYAASLA